MATARTPTTVCGSRSMVAQASIKPIADQCKELPRVGAAEIREHRKRCNTHDSYSISFSDCWCLSCDRVADHIGRAGPYLPRQIHTDGRCCCHGTAADRSRLQ